MEARQPSSESKAATLADLDFPKGAGPLPHPPQAVDPRVVEAHFAPLLKDGPSPEQRLAKKAGFIPFPGM